MSITRDRGKIIFQCDASKCLKTLEAHTSNWDVARDLREAADWTETRAPLAGKPNWPVKSTRDDSWKHLCADCAARRAS